MEAFFANIGIVPKCLVSYFETKLIRGLAREYLNSLLIHVNAAPSYCQDKNGLVERHWQMMVSMACNWLASAEYLHPFGSMLFVVRLKGVITFHLDLKLVHSLLRFNCTS